MDNEWIKELKAGDKVIVLNPYITSRYKTSLSTVEKVSKTFLTVGGRKFNRTNGMSDDSAILYPATPENIEAIDLAKARHSFVIQAKVVAKSATIEQLQQAAKILGFEI